MRCIKLHQSISWMLQNLRRGDNKNAPRCGTCRHYASGWCTVLAMRRRTDDRCCDYGVKIRRSEAAAAAPSRRKKRVRPRKKGGRK